MSQYIFGQPYTYKDWFIFPDTTLDNIRVDDCPSSVTGKCENTKTVEDCIQICHDNQPCFSGYFIETPDRKNICVPMKKISGGNIGLYYRLRNKNIYPILKGMKSYIFTNKSYTYPPDHANSIFYTDKLILTNIISQKSIGVTDEGENYSSETLTDSPAFIQFLPKEVIRTNISQYLIVKNGDEVIINIPYTAYILKENSENNISWVLKLSSLRGTDNSFRVFSTDKNKKIGDNLNYQDTLYFTSQGKPIIYDGDSHMLKTTSISIENEIQKNDNMYFKTIPKINVYYCENEKCKSVMLDQTEMNEEKSRYKGIPVSRSPSCWGCQSSKKIVSWWWIYILIFFAIITLFIFILIFRKQRFLV